MPEPADVTMESAADLLKGFGAFGDAVVRVAEFEMHSTGWTARVELDAQDGAAEWEWRRVRFDFEKVDEWRFERINTATEVIFESSIHAFGDLIYVCFDGLPAEASIEDVRSTHFYLAAGRCTFRAPMGGP